MKTTTLCTSMSIWWYSTPLTYYIKRIAYLGLTDWTREHRFSWIPKFAGDRRPHQRSSVHLFTSSSPSRSVHGPLLTAFKHGLHFTSFTRLFWFLSGNKDDRQWRKYSCACHCRFASSWYFHYLVRWLKSSLDNNNNKSKQEPVVPQRTCQNHQELPRNNMPAFTEQFLSPCYT